MKPINKIVIHEAIVTELVNYIKNNNLQKNDKLPSERKLVEILQVSRPSVREALKILEANNVIEIKHGSGIYIKSENGLAFTEYDTNTKTRDVLLKLKKLAEARLMIEKYAAVEVSKIITDEQIKVLFEIESIENKTLSDNTEIEKSNFVNLNIERKITSYLKNPFINDFHSKLENLWQNYFSHIKSIPYPKSLRHNDHINIIKAIESKKENLITKNIEIHIQRTVKSLDKLIENCKTK